jgi:hypothetical protein
VLGELTTNVSRPRSIVGFYLVGTGARQPPSRRRGLRPPPGACPEREDDGSCPLRTVDIIPDFALDRSDEHPRGNNYAVWMDTRFNDADHNDIVLSR